MVHASLGPRPKTNSSADRFQYHVRYTGSDVTRRMRSGDETRYTHAKEEGLVNIVHNPTTLALILNFTKGMPLKLLAGLQ